MSSPASSTEIVSSASTPIVEKKLDMVAHQGPTKYKHSFWDPEMAPFRKVAYKILGGGTALTIVVMWLALPLYWGSLWLSNKFTQNLSVVIIDFDGDFIGHGVTAALLNNTQLGYYASSADWSLQSIQDAIVNEDMWAAVVINQGATAALESARQFGNTSYMGTSAVSVYYNQGRSDLAVNSYLEPYLQATLGKVTFQLGAESIARYIGENLSNATAISLLAQAPTAVTNAVAWEMINLRPFTQPVATAITLVGMIYMVIFAFNVTMMGMAARGVFESYMNTRSLIIFRLVAPLVLYLPTALAFAMINLPFKVNFGAHYTYAGGFFLWAFTTYLGLCCLGMATEFALTALGPSLIGFFLVALIIVNVSVVSLPRQLQPWIYGYQSAMPLYNIGRIVRTIVFNTKNEIGQHIGILLAWIVVSMITVTVATWYTHRKAEKMYAAGLSAGMAKA